MSTGHHDENGRKPADAGRIMVGERVAGGRQTLLYVVIWWNKENCRTEFLGCKTLYMFKFR